MRHRCTPATTKSCTAKRALIRVYEDPGPSLGVAVHGGNVEQQRGAQERYQHHKAAASRRQLQQARSAAARASPCGARRAGFRADDDDIVWSWFPPSAMLCGTGQRWRREDALNDRAVQPRSVVGVVRKDHQERLLAWPTHDGSRAALEPGPGKDREQNDDRQPEGSTTATHPNSGAGRRVRIL